MVFSSLFFTFFFLPLVIFLYFISKEKYRNYILLAASLLFYAYGEPRFVIVMLFSVVMNYAMAVFINRKKESGRGMFARNLLIAAVLANLGILFLFKYVGFSVRVCNMIFRTEFSVPRIRLPIGISFFTFQAMSYVVDVYRGTVQVQKNPLYVALYIAFFPQLIAGPIVRYSTIERQITDRTCTIEKCSEGIRRFFLGFAKKVILANNLAVVASEVFAKESSSANPLVLWLGAVCYSLQIFYDFSGYSDMAIGLGKIFGFEFEENFNYPYITKSVTEFWRRWHISLGKWFRDYVYIPMGGSRVSVPRHILNMLVVWVLTGIWHGANFTFIAWGLGFFALLLLEKYLVRPERLPNAVLSALWRFVTLVCILFGWVMFNSVGLRHGISYITAMLGRSSAPFAFDADMFRYMREYGVFLLAGILFSTPVMPRVRGFVIRRLPEKLTGIAIPVLYGIIFLWAVSFIILGAHNPFIYFNF